MAGFTERRGQTPEKRLHRIVYAFLAGLSAAAAAPPLGRILAHEAMHPTPQMDRLVEDMARPQLERLRAVVRELAGPAAPEREVTLAALAVAGHCVMYLFGRSALDRVFPGVLTGPHSIARLARQVTDFALAGIRHQQSNPPAAARRVAKKGGFPGH
jgi:hypothetical protein